MNKSLLESFILMKYVSLDDFSETAGVFKSTVEKLIKDYKADVSCRELIAICKTLKIDVNSMLNGNIVPVSHKWDDENGIPDLKSFILAKYKTVSDFCKCSELSSKEVLNIIKNGPLSSTSSIIKTFCESLSIDMTYLLEGYIVSVNKEWNEKDKEQIQEALKEMKKNFVLDTNILLHDPDSIFKFEDNNVFIPHPVLEELDKFKTDKNERGFNARHALRNIKDLRENGNLIDGIKNNQGGTLKIIFYENLDFSVLPPGFKKDVMDNIILLTAKELSKDTGNVILVTNDINMQLKADTLGIEVQEYRNDRIKSEEDIYSGKSLVYVDENTMGEFYKNGSVEVPKEWEDYGILTNEYIIMKTGSNGSAIGKYYDGAVHKLFRYDKNPFDIKPRNVSQKFLLESLMTGCDEIPLTICNGPAGTGKTLLAIGAGLEQVMNKKIYKKVLFTRANVMMDEEIGFLPGTEVEKISPLLRGLRDNLEVLLVNEDDTAKEAEDKVEELFQRRYIVTESIAYLRGRSISDTFIIIDEAQNCTPNQIFSIITRVGLNSKLVILGDINQVDNSRLDSRTNGLIYALERMKGAKCCDITSFDEGDCERSILAKEASDRLRK